MYAPAEAWRQRRMDVGVELCELVWREGGGVAALLDACQMWVT